MLFKLAEEFLKRLPDLPSSLSFSTDEPSLQKYRLKVATDILASSGKILSSYLKLFFVSVNEYVVQNWPNQNFFHFLWPMLHSPPLWQPSRTVPTVEMPLLGSSSTVQLLW